MAKINRFTVQQVEDAVRLLLLDTDAGSYRFEPKEIHLAMVDALERVRSERPASQYVGGLITDLRFLDINYSSSDAGVINTTNILYVPPESYGTTAEVDAFRSRYVDMERRWLQAVVNFVVHRMYMKDDNDTKNDELSNRYLELYKTALGG